MSANRPGAPWPKGHACPKCGYDVWPTLTQGIATCPECGVMVAEAAALVARTRLEPWRGMALIALFLAGTLMMHLIFFLGFAERIGGVGVLGVMFDRDWVGFASLGACVAVCEGLTGLVWYRYERRRTPTRARTRAIVWVVLGMVAQALLAGSCAWEFAHLSD